MFNTTKICPSCHQRKVQTSDKLTPSGSFVWEIYRVIILFVPTIIIKKVQTSDKLTPSGSFVWEIYRVIILFVSTIIIVNWSKFLTLAQNTQTGFFLGFLLCLYLFLAYTNAVYLR